MCIDEKEQTEEETEAGVAAKNSFRAAKVVEGKPNTITCSFPLDDSMMVRTRGRMNC
jgi:hypothetical protein